MEENKKVYSVIGTVTIGTDEYRDLIAEKFAAEKEKTEWHNKWYDEYCAKGKLENECKKLKEELDKCKNYIKKTSPTEEAISIVMSMLGEE